MFLNDAKASDYNETIKSVTDTVMQNHASIITKSIANSDLNSNMKTINRAINIHVGDADCEMHFYGFNISEETMQLIRQISEHHNIPIFGDCLE